ncbi:MAG: electron transfer flavoprotein subunit beta/FixA family protein [Bacteroidales bacterium]|nr:electron transfer flavoprotein subunit beta/FixA family protein [Bacteroidales bacterium]
MKIIVCVKQVPDTMDVKFNDDFTLQRDHIAQILNPADESALELGLALRDETCGTLSVLTMGPARVQKMLREIISRGADKAYQLTDSAFAGADTLATARTLKAAINKLGAYDLILCGRRAADGETGQVGPMLASLMDIACVTNAVHVQVDGPQAQVAQLTEEGLQNWQCNLPSLITLCEWSYRLRLPSFAGLKQARDAEITQLTHSDIGIEKSATGIKGSPTRVVGANARNLGIRECHMVDVSKLLEILP